MTPAACERLILFSGMGADQRLYDDVSRLLPRLEAPAWIEPRPHEPLREYARRFVELLRPDASTVIGGTSFGGMLALEVARLSPPRAVALIGSCRRIDQVAWWFRSMEPLRLLLPDAMFTARAPAALFVHHALGVRDPRQREFHLEMLRAVGPRFVKWAAWASVRWEGVAEPPCPVFAIHGERDRLMPLARARADRVVFGAGHVLALTSPREVAEFLRGICGWPELAPA
jgi:pimeloyl-ACP methyl ester carboxylesterase